MDVVDDKAGAGQRAPEDRQKIDQERSSACDDGRYADTRHGLGPARGRRLSRPLCTERGKGADRQCEPALLARAASGRPCFRNRSRRAGQGWRRSFPAVRRESSASRADDPFHDAAIVRLSQRAIVQPDAMLLATLGAGPRSELGRVVRVEQQGLAAHLPIHFHVQSFQPRALVAGDMHEAQANRKRQTALPA